MTLFYLLWKNYLLFKRNLFPFFFLFFSPLLVFIIIIIIQKNANYIFEHEELNPPIQKSPKISKCKEENCVTLGYAVVGKKIYWVDYVMKYVAFQNELDMEKDIKMFYEGEDLETYFQPFEKYQGKISTGL